MHLLRVTCRDYDNRVITFQASNGKLTLLLPQDEERFALAVDKPVTLFAGFSAEVAYLGAERGVVGLTDGIASLPD